MDRAAHLCDRRFEQVVLQLYVVWIFLFNFRVIWW